MNDNKPNSSGSSDNSTLSGWSGILKTLGPGLLMACAAIGASHLLWSTRAGALYGWTLAGILLLVNFLKFPFFYYGQRYSAAARESLLEGYQRLGKGYLILFLIVTLLTGSISIAGVSMLTGAILSAVNIWPEGTKDLHLGVAVILVCAVLLLIGRYRVIDRLAKVVMAFLTLVTLFAVAVTLPSYTPPPPTFQAPELLTLATLTFLVYLIGWMPAPMDVSSWSSLWMFGRQKETGHQPTVRETTIDFGLGYSLTTLLALAFLALGALVMFGSGVEPAAGGAAFTNQLVNLYSSTIGEWSRPFILAAALMTIGSTTLTVMDGFPRSLATALALLLKQPKSSFLTLHRIMLFFHTAVAILILLLFVQNLLQLLQWATAIAFLTSPVLAWLNFRVIQLPNVPAPYRPGPFLTFMSWTGLTFFLISVIGFGYVLLFAR